eukprot:6319674-Alexandrium_andersonii.AAC.1
MAVAGGLRDRISSGLNALEHAELLVDRATLGADCGALLSDFSLAKSQILHQVTVKLRFATVLPTASRGVARPDEDVARVIATQCVEQYDAGGSGSGTPRHSQSIRALDPIASDGMPRSN